MTDAEMLAHIREFCNAITQRTVWDAYDLACEIRDYIDDPDFTGPLPIGGAA